MINNTTIDDALLFGGEQQSEWLQGFEHERIKHYVAIDEIEPSPAGENRNLQTFLRTVMVTHEQDADSVLMLHREDYYDPDTDKKGLTDICVRKNRNGPVGESELYFEKTIMKFTEINSSK